MPSVTTHIVPLMLHLRLISLLRFSVGNGEGTLLHPICTDFLMIAVSVEI